MRFKINNGIYKILTSRAIELIYIVILILIFLLMDMLVLRRHFNFQNYFELKLATSVSATYFIAVIIKGIVHRIEGDIEDGLKLETDYNKIINKYAKNLDKMVCHKKNDLKLIVAKDLKNENNDDVIYPILIEYRNYNGHSLGIEDDKDKMYALPGVIEANYMKLFSSHKHSKIFNALNIRLDDALVKDDGLVLKTSRTTYFNSLVTNRAMDHSFGSGLTVRKLFEYGKQINDLNSSSLSNHLGLNGFFLTSDQKLVFVKRFKNVSIGKNILGCSVGASLKTDTALDENGVFSLKGLEDSIKSEINNELGLEPGDYKFSLNGNIIAFYRDLIEGGKPQLLVMFETKLSANDLDAKFKAVKIKNNKEKNKNKRNMIIDGTKLVFMDMYDIDLRNNQIIHGSKKYETIPSVAASVAVALDYLRQKNKTTNISV